MPLFPMLLALISCHSSYSFNGDRLSAVFLAYFPLTSYHFTFVFLTAVKLIIIIIIIIIITYHAGGRVLPLMLTTTYAILERHIKCMVLPGQTLLLAHTNSILY